MDDTNSLRNLSGNLLDVEGPLPVDGEGRVDVFKIISSEWARESDMVDFCHSKRFDEGPTIAQIRASDYTDFSYARGWPSGPDSRPILWDRRAWSESEKGHRLVAFADGAVKRLTKDQFAKLDLGVPAR